MTAPEPTEIQVVELAQVIRSGHLGGKQVPWEDAEGYIQDAWMNGGRAAWAYVVTALAAAPVAEEAETLRDGHWRDLRDLLRWAVAGKSYGSPRVVALAIHRLRADLARAEEED